MCGCFQQFPLAVYFFPTGIKILTSIPAIRRCGSVAIFLVISAVAPSMSMPRSRAAMPIIGHHARAEGGRGEVGRAEGFAFSVVVGRGVGDDLVARKLVDGLVSKKS